MNGIKVWGRLATVALLLVSSLGQAEVLKFNFTAHGTSIGDTGPAPEGALALLPVTSTITGSFFYDTSIPVSYPTVNPDGTSYASYISTTAIGITLTGSGGYQFVNNVTDEFYEPTVLVDNAISSSPEPFDTVKVAAFMRDGSGGMHDVAFMLKDRHNAGTLTGYGLPSSLSLLDYDGTLSIYWSDSSGNAFQLNAAIDTLQLAPVPEPETYAMLLAGLGLLAVAARRTQRQGAA